MAQFFLVTLNGLTLAGVYFLVASGLTIIFGLMRDVHDPKGLFRTYMLPGEPITLLRLFAIDSYAWERITAWLRKKHRRLGWPELRRRYCPEPGDSPTTGNGSPAQPASRSPDTATAATTSPPLGIDQLPPPAEPTTTHGEPDAVKVARPVQRAAWGNGPRSNPDTAPQADPTGTTCPSSRSPTVAEGPRLVVRVVS